MIQSLVTIGCLSVMDEAALYTITEQKLTNEHLEKLYASIKSIDHIKVINELLNTERTYGLTYFNGGTKQDSPASLFYTISGIGNLNALRYSEIMDDLKSATQKDYYSMQQEYERINQEIADMNTYIYQPTKMVFPAISRSIILLGTNIAEQEIIKVILTNEMYKNENGGYAEKAGSTKGI